MGQQVSVPGVVPSVKELAWKTGKKSHVVPHSLATALTMESLSTNSDFKDALLLMLDSDYLVSSLLSDSCSDDSILLSGIQNYQALNQELITKIVEQTKNFKEINNAGISVSLPETLDITENDIAAKKSLKCSPFLRNFQKRLIALEGLKEGVQNERAMALEKRKLREYSAVQSLDVDRFPQLAPLSALLDAGFSFLQLIPMLLESDAFKLDSQPLVAPIVKFENSLSMIPALALFKTWSPKPIPPLRALSINKSSANASVGTAADVFEKPNIGWLGSKSSCSWSIDVTSEEVINFITVHWASNNTPVLNGAPKCVTISSRPIDPTASSPQKSMAGFEVHSLVYPETEYKKQNSWVQVYPLGVKGPATIHLLMSKTASSNNTSTGIRLFGFSAGIEDMSMKCSDTIVMLNNIKESLTPLGSIPVMAESVCKSLISLPYISGSLSISLALFEYMLFGKYERTVRESSKVEFMRLVTAIYEEEKAILQSDVLAIRDKMRDDITFDDKCKSNDCTLSENGMLATFTTSSAFVLGNCPMESGSWTWEISIIQDSNGDETSTLGIARRPLSSNSYENNSNTWVVRCYNGELYHSGRNGSRTLPAIHPKDVCRFTLDCDAQTLSLVVNDVDHGVIFEGVPSGVYIYASFYSSVKSVRLLSVKQHAVAESVSGNTNKSLPLEFQSRNPTESYLDNEENWSAMFLEAVSSLAQSHVSHRTSSKPIALESPFCIEVSLEVFETVIALLERIQRLLVLSDEEVTSKHFNRMATSLLRILDAFFATLSSSKIDISEVGFKYTRKSVDIAQTSSEETSESMLGDVIFANGRVSDSIGKCHTVLSALRSSSDEAVCLLAATVLARGSILLFPNPVDKLKLINSTFDSIVPGLSSGSIKANSALLRLLLSQIHEVSEISLLLIQYKSGSISSSFFFDVCNRLISVVSIEPVFAVQASSGGIDAMEVTANMLSIDKSIVKECTKILLKWQQHIVYEYSVCRSKYVELINQRVKDLFDRFSSIIIAAASMFCKNGIASIAGCSKLQATQIETAFEESLLLKLMFALLHSFCFCLDDSMILQSLLPKAVDLFNDISGFVRESQKCAIATVALNDFIKRKIPEAEACSEEGKSGWRKVKGAAFESGESSYTVTENGLMYTSVFSSNTCALVTLDSLTRYAKLAWEFELVSDSTNDQCSVFGASRKNPSSRCYSSSGDLWMRRAYNGYMYCNGTSTGSAMDKIHPGDIVRIEHDMKSGTISFSVNSGPLSVGFSGVNEFIYPACGSYRTGVQIRLLKVEVLGSGAVASAGHADIVENPQIGRWDLPEQLCEESGRDFSLLAHKKSKDSKTDDKESQNTSWLTCKSISGASFGVHEWSFELLENPRATFGVGVVFGGSKPESSDPLSSYTPTVICRAEANATAAAAATAAATTAVTALSNESESSSAAVESSTAAEQATITSVEVAESAIAESIAAITVDSVTVSPTSPVEDAVTSSEGLNSAIDVAVGSVADSKLATDVETKNTKARSLAWFSDGTLWADGKKVSSAFGSKFSSFQKNASIILRVDRLQNTISFLVNGEFVGVAFGPAGTDAAATYELPVAGAGDIDVLYPAASISSPSQVIKITPAGLYGSVVVPFAVTFQKACSSVIGRLAAVLVAGPPIDKKETQVLSWLQSPLLIGGINPSSSVEDRRGAFIRQVVSMQGDAPLSVEGRLLVEWFESYNPEPVLLRKNMESRGCFRFLQCELPFMCALMKHGGLVDEVLNAISSVKANNPVTDLNDPAISQLVSELRAIQPSADLLALWIRVKQLRMQLRQERQIFNSKVIVDSAINVEQKLALEAVVASPAVQTSPELALLITDDASLFNSSQTAWMIQPSSTCSRFNSSYYCDILAVGYDYSNSTLLIRFHVHGDQSLGSLQPPSNSTITVLNSDVIRTSKHNYSRQSATEYLGTLVFDVEQDVIGTPTFKFGSSGYSAAGLILPNRAAIGNNSRLGAAESQSTESSRNVDTSSDVAESGSASVSVSVGATPTEEPRDVDRTLEYLRLLLDSDETMYHSESTTWRLMPTATVSRYDLNYYCTVLAVGFDFEYSTLLIRFRVCGNGSLGALQSPLQSRLIVDDEDEVSQECDSNEFYYAREDSNSEIIGTIRFEAEYDALADVPGGQFFFSYGESGYSRTPILLPDRDTVGNNNTFANALITAAANNSASSAKEAAEETIAAPKSFEEYCKRIEDRSRFLLRFKSTAEVNESDFEESRSRLSSTPSALVGGLRGGRFRGDDGYHRWKQVIEFLKVHSKLKRQNSTESLRQISSPAFAEHTPEYHLQRANSLQRSLSQQSLPSVPSVSVEEEILLRETSTLAEIEDEPYTISPAQASMQAAALFITGSTVTVSTDLLERVLKTREIRANCRLAAFKNLFNTITIATGADDFHSIEEMLLFVRSAMKSNVNSLSSEDALSKSRIHYLCNLEGCSQSINHSVQDSFLNFYAALSQLLNRFIENWEGCSQDITHNHLFLNSIEMLLSMWCIHFSSRDHKFLYHCGLLPALFKLISLSTYENAAQTWCAAADKYSDFITTHATQVPSKLVPWKLWSDEFVVDGLKDGSLSCRSLQLMMAMAPSNQMSNTLRSQYGVKSFRQMREEYGIVESSFVFQKMSNGFRKIREKVEKEKEKEIEELESSKSAKVAAINELLGDCGKFDDKYCASSVKLSSGQLEASVSSGTSHEPVCVMATVNYDLAVGFEETGNYFEVEIILVGRGDIGVGLCNRTILPLKGRMPGWDAAGSYGYHGDDGKKFGPGGTPGDWPLWATGDIIGCGINLARRSIFYTRNGSLLGEAFTNVSESSLYPVVGFALQHGTPEKVSINFGSKPFAYSGPEVIQMPKAIAARDQCKDKFDEVTAISGQLSRLVASPTLLMLVDSDIDGQQVQISEKEFTSQLKQLKSKLDVSNSYLYELVKIRSLASAVLSFLLIVTRYSQDEATNTDDSAGKPSNSAALVPSGPSKLAKSTSAFGTPHQITSADGQTLQEGIVSVLIQEIIVGTDYLMLMQEPREHEGSCRQHALIAPPPQRAMRTIADLQRSTLGSDSNSSSSSLSSAVRGEVVVEAAEVETMLYEHLKSLNSLIANSSLLVEELSGCQVLRGLFDLLLVGSPRVVQVVYQILNHCLPAISPDDAERAISNAWQQHIGKKDIDGTSTSRRRRKLPSSTVQMLLWIVQQPVSFSNDMKLKYVSYGFGDNVILNADNSIHLLQRLFENATWTEVISCTLTDSFREALAVLESNQLAETGFDLSSEKIRIIRTTAAVLSMFSGYSSMRPGARVKCLEGPSIGAEGYLVAVNELEQTAKVVFVDKPKIDNLDKVETVGINTIEVILETVKVDLSRLSQPVVPQLVSLVKLALQFARQIHDGNSTLTRLTQSQSSLLALARNCATALWTLMESNSDQLIHGLIDVNLIEDIISLSLLPAGISSFVNVNSVSKMWLFVHCRNIEHSILFNNASNNELPVAITSISTAVTDNAAIADSTSKAIEEVSTTAANISEADKIRISSELSSELSVSVETCATRLEYFSWDIAAATSSIMADKTDSDDFDVVPVDIADGDTVEQATSSGESHSHLFRQIEYADGSDESTKASNETVDGLYKFDLIDIPDQNRVLLRSYVTECDQSGVVHNASAPIGVCFDDEDGADVVLCGFQDPALGVVLFQAHCTMSVKSVASFYGYQPKNLDIFLNQLNFASAVLRLREIAAKLLIDGSLNLENDVKKPSDWLLLMKLVSASSSEPSSGQQLIDGTKLAAMCSSLLSRTSNAKNALPVAAAAAAAASSQIALTNAGQSEASASASTASSSSSSSSASSGDVQMWTVDEVGQSIGDSQVVSSESLESRIGKIIADDLEEEISSLSVSKQLPSSLKGQSVTMPMKFSSPHPFACPTNLLREVAIPVSWKRAKVVFHPKCSTPCKDTKLEFFASRADVDSGNAMYAFYESSANFKSFMLPSGTKSFFYRFVASESANQPQLALKMGSETVDKSDLKGKAVVVKTASEGAVGLGEEDTLANLFGEAEITASSETVQITFDTIKVTCEMTGLGLGCWYFETTVVENDCLAGVRSVVTAACPSLSADALEQIVDEKHLELLDSIRVGFAGAIRKDAKVGCYDESTGLDAAGGIHHYVDEVEEIGQIIRPWQTGDVIGSLLVVTEDEICTIYSLNGVWGGVNRAKRSATSGLRRPVLEYSGQIHLSANFGEKPFVYDPLAGLLEAIGDSIVPAITSVLPVISRPLDENDFAKSWGYCFKVHEVSELNTLRARVFDQIWSRDGDSDKDYMTIWKPKAVGEYLPCCDVITKSKKPPIGALLVHKKLCSPAKSFKKVFSTDDKLFIWRPVAPDGYVAMGDWATTSPSAPPVDSCMCLPDWAVKQCNLSKKVYTSKKVVSIGGKDKNCIACIWSTFSGLGSFIANPTDSLISAVNKVETEVEVVKTSYALANSHGFMSLMNGEWVAEDVIESHGSLAWCAAMFGNVLENPLTRKFVVTDSMFSILVNYLKSNSAPDPFKVVLMLVHFIRSAYNPQFQVIPLPILQLDSLCKAVLSKAIAKKEKGGLLPDQLYSLVDLVVEVIIVQFGDGSDGEAVASAAAASANLIKEDGEAAVAPVGAVDDEVTSSVPTKLSRELSEQIDDVDAEQLPIASLPPFEPPISTVAYDASNWWQRPKIDSRIIDAARMLALKKIEPIFSKDPALRKLKYSIKFFTALESLRNKVRSKNVAFPKRMICKLWYDYLSTCVFDESSHPIKPDTDYSRNICFPGAEKLIITFDKRCAIAPGNFLEVKGNETYKFDDSSKSWQTITINGDSVKLLYGRVPKNEDKAVESASSGKASETTSSADEIVSSESSAAVVSESKAESVTVEQIDATEAVQAPAVADAESTAAVEGESTAAAAVEVKVVEEVNYWGWGFVLHAVGPVFESSMAHFSATVHQAIINSELASPSADDDVITRGIFGDSTGVEGADADKEGSAVAPVVEAEGEAKEPSPAAATSESSVDTPVIGINETGEADIIRPVSRAQNRGDSSRRGESSVDEADTAAAADILSNCGGELSDSNEAFVLPLVASRGAEIQSGELAVPHAKEVDVTILPRISKSATVSLIYVMKLMCCGSGAKAEDTFVRVGGDDAQCACTLPTDRVKYTLHVMSEDKLKAIIQARKVQAEAIAAATAASTASAAVSEELCKTASSDGAAVDAEATASSVSAAGAVAGSATATAASSSSAVGASTAAATVAAESVADPLAPWACALCTMLNPYDEAVCIMCMTPRAAEGDAPAAPSASTGWWCSVCTYINPLTESSCGMCASARMDGGTAAAAPAEAPAAERTRRPSDASREATESVTEFDEAVDVDSENDDEDGDEESEPESGDVSRPRARSRSRTRSASDSAPTATATADAGSTGASNSDRVGSDAAGGDINAQSSASAKALPAAKVSYGNCKDTVLSSKAKKLRSTYNGSFVVVQLKGKLTSTMKFETRLEGLLSMGKGIITPLDISNKMLEWTSEMDSNILEYVNKELSNTTKGSEIFASKVVLPRTQLQYAYANLSHVSMLEIQTRVMLIEAMNDALEEILQIINFGNSDPRSFGATIRRYSKYVFMSLKTPLLEKAIKQSAATGAGMPAQLTLDNFIAIESIEKGLKDPATSTCTFVQAFKQLLGKPTAVFRHSFNDARIFQITFKGESGIDAGGVFREGMSRIVEDVFSDHFNLLLLCPNGQHSVHINTDKYVPNPQHTGPLAMQMFEFLGRLMGASLRVKLCLPFQFPNIIWKKLIGEDVVLEDLMNFDALTYRLIQAIRNCESDGICDQEAFSLKYKDQLRFTYNGSDGVERELVKGQRNRLVTFDTRHEYCDLLVAARLSEFDKQVAAMTTGLLDVVPSRVLQLFSASQVEILIAGNPNFDIELWKKQTDASSISPKTLALFWEVMESLTPQEQSGFVRFAWGRSRLPAAKDFTIKMKLTSAGSSRLPVAHTCFFSIEMPEYGTLEEMRHGLLTVINFGCGGILNG